MQTILSLVEAEEGVAVVPASISNLRSDGVQFVRLVPDLYLDLIVAWRLGAPSVVLHLPRLSKCQYGRDSCQGRTCSIFHHPDQVITVFCGELNSRVVGHLEVVLRVAESRRFRPHA